MAAFREVWRRITQKIPEVITVCAAIAAIASAATAVYQARVATSQLKLAEAKFSEIELPTLLGEIRARVDLDFDPSSLKAGQPLERAAFVARLRNRSDEELSDVFVFIRLRLQQRETGEFEERELASHFESVIYPGPTAIQMDLGAPARTTIRQYKDTLLVSHLPRTLLLQAEWRAKSGHRIEITRGYSLSERRK